MRYLGAALTGMPMRGAQPLQQTLFILCSVEERIPADHPLRPLRATVDRLLSRLSPTFDAMYATIGRPSIPPEFLLKAWLLQILYSIRSERELVEQVNFNLLYRWFVGVNADAEIWDASTFSKNRERLEGAEVAARFFGEVKAHAAQQGLLSHAHFTVDGTLLDAAASLKNFRPRDAAPPPDDPAAPAAGAGASGASPSRNPTVNFRGERRTNATHESRTDPDARLTRKGPGKEAKLCHLASVAMENRHGLIVATDVRPPDGSAEVEAAVDLLTTLASPTDDQRKTVGGDKGYDQPAFVERARALGFTPHVAQKATGTAIDGRTTWHPGYAVSQKKRKLVEQNFGWGKTVGLLRKLRHRGQHRVAAIFTFTCAAFNLIRMRTLLGEVSPCGS
jgi:transposase